MSCLVLEGSLEGTAGGNTAKDKMGRESGATEACNL